MSEVWESYPLEFVLILFEDSGFYNVNYSLLLSSYSLVQNKSSNKLNPTHNLPQMLSRAYDSV